MPACVTQTDLQLYGLVWQVGIEQTYCTVFSVPPFQVCIA